MPGNQGAILYIAGKLIKASCDRFDLAHFVIYSVLMEFYGDIGHRRQGRYVAAAIVVDRFGAGIGLWRLRGATATLARTLTTVAILATRRSVDFRSLQPRTR